MLSEWFIDMLDISSVRTFKYLGVAFDNFMIWKTHADYLCKMMSNRVRILGFSRAFVRREAAIFVYNIMNLPVFDYCDIAWSSLLC